MLLYLAPGKTVRLAEVLRRFESFILEGEAPGLALHLIRKDLFDLVYPLSPLSNTRKLASEILDFTEDYLPANKKVIEEFISAMQDIYKIRETGEAIHIAGPATTNA